MAIDMTAANALPEGGEAFFKIFSRYEFALKDQKFLTVDHRGKVSANWDAFANSDPIGRAFFDLMVTQQACPTLLEKPPSKQRVASDGSLYFEKEPQLPKTVQELFGTICRVRNNLFHGGKSGEPDEKRNPLLIREATVVLIKALERHGDVRMAFEGRS